jgi:hypothetical protein
VFAVASSHSSSGGTAFFLLPINRAAILHEKICAIYIEYENKIEIPAAAGKNISSRLLKKSRCTASWSF